MVEFKKSTVLVIEKAKGSEDLANALLVGDLKNIAKRFQRPYATVSSIVRGRQYGDKNIVECAERIIAFYKEVEIEKNVKQIIESYEPKPAHKNRN